MNKTDINREREEEEKNNLKDKFTIKRGVFKNDLFN